VTAGREHSGTIAGRTGATFLGCRSRRRRDDQLATNTSCQTGSLTGQQFRVERCRVSDVPQTRVRRPRVHHLDHDVAVADTGTDILLTTADAMTRLTAERARVIGWALIEAAASIESDA